jgi:SAM-dependent methyltransferase
MKRRFFGAVAAVLVASVYYARRAAEYDATSWEAFDEAELETAERFVASLPVGRTLDIGCGTGFLTRYLRSDASSRTCGQVTGRMPRPGQPPLAGRSSWR